MTRCILIIWMLLLTTGIFAQFFPLSDHYQGNTLIINPAFAGCDGALSATFQYRDQWVGFKDAPKTSIFSVHTPLSYDKMGAGLLISHDAFGIYKKSAIMGNYAYRIRLPQSTIALGLGIGFTMYNFSWNQLEASDEDDLVLTGNPSKAILPDFSIGAYYYSRKYFIGFSIPWFLIHISDQSTGKYRARNDVSSYNYFFTAGYEYTMNEYLKLLPSALLNIAPNSKTLADFYLQCSLKERISLAVGYRTSEVMIGMLKLAVNDQLRIAYSYDLDMGKTGTYKNGSHEILLGYTFKYKRNVMDPRQL